MTTLMLAIALLGVQGPEEPKVLASLTQEASVMQTWACAGRTNAAIAPQVSATYEGSRQAALSYIATATAEIKKGIEKGGPELEIPDLEAIGKATNAVGSARRKFFDLLFAAELTEAAEVCGSRSSLDKYDCNKTKDILTCLGNSMEPFTSIAGWMRVQAAAGKNKKERLALLDGARTKVLERLWKKLP